MFDARITSDDLSRVSRRFRAEANGKEIRRDTIRELRGVVRPIQGELKSIARGLPAAPGGSVLRKDIAAAIGTQVRVSGPRAGVAVKVGRRRLGDRGGVARATNRPGWWRHPVFGDREVWVRQEPGWRGWFDRHMQRRAPSARRQMKKVLDAVEKRLSS